MAGNVTARVFISYARSDGEVFATRLREKLEVQSIPLWQDRVGIEGGRDWWLQIQEALDHVHFMILVMTPAALRSPMVKKEWRYARQQGVCVYPVKAQADLDFQSLPRWMHDAHWYDLDTEWNKFLNDLDRTCEQPRVPFMVEDLPVNFVQRPDAFEPLIRSLLDEKREEPIAITAALRGAGGYGKTTLARALCHDERVQEAFDDGILWVTFGAQPSNLVNKIEELLYTLNREKPGYTSIEAATTRLVELLADRDILLVLDDVWNSAHLKPFLQGGKRCARLITTRDERVIPSSVPVAQRIQVDAMQQDEAIQLLISSIHGFDEQIFLKQHYTELKRLATRLGEWPLLLMLARSMLQERINLYMPDVARAITAVHRALDKRGVTAFDLSNAVERSQAVAKTIETSFEALQPEERERYRELAIFPEDVAIPLQTLHQLWGKTGNLDEFDTEDLCIRLRSLSLLLDYNSVTQMVRLHDVMCAYLQHQYAPAELAQLHARFLDTYTVKRWADLPQDEPYLWDHLATHLIAAGRTVELITTVMDGAYLAFKAYYRPVSLLEQDLEFAIKHDLANPVLRCLQHSIINMAHLLHACQTWQECASILHSRLVHFPELQSICQEIEHRFHQPCLTAWHALPDLPVSALKRTLTGHTDTVRVCAISPDGTWLLSASSDGTLRIWDAASGLCRHTLFSYNQWISVCAISPDSTWLVSASDDHTLRIWDTDSGKIRQTLTGYTGWITACAISPDGTWLLSASSDGTLIIWDAASGRIRQALTGHIQEVSACAISPDGMWLLSASSDGILIIWDAASGKVRHTLIGHTELVNACAISPDGTWLLSASGDGTLIIWDAASGKSRHILARHSSSVLFCVISPDGTWLLSASGDGTLIIWDAASGKIRQALIGHIQEVSACAISPDGTWLLCAYYDHTLRIWDAVSGKIRQALTGHIREVRACAISPDGTWLLSASNDHTLRIWDTSDQLYHTLADHVHGVRACAISPDGTWLLSASDDHTQMIWDLASGKIRQTLTGHASLVTACAISPDGTWLLCAYYDHTLRIWDAVSGKIRQTLTGHSSLVTACAISPDGTWLLSASGDGTLIIWDVVSGKIRQTLTGHTKLVTACAISPDGTWLLSASHDRTLIIWDAVSGKIRQTLTGHSSLVTACAIASDGTWLLSTSDSTLKVWDVATTQCVATLRVNGELRSCLFCGDRYHIVAGGASGVYFLRVVDNKQGEIALGESSSCLTSTVTIEAQQAAREGN